MITRTIRAENMLTALEVIKKEMGSDALVVSVRQIMSGPSWQVWRKPLVEVVAVKLVEGEPPELLKIAMAQHQQTLPENQGDLSVDALQKAAEREMLLETQPDLKPEEPARRPSASFQAPQAPQAPQVPKKADPPNNSFEEANNVLYSQAGLPSLDKNRNQSLLAKKYQLAPQSNPPEEEKEQPEVSAEAVLAMLIRKAQAAEAAAAVSQPITNPVPEEQPRKREVSAPVFEHLVTNSPPAPNRKEEADAVETRNRKKPPIPAARPETVRAERQTLNELPSMVSKTSQYLIKHGLDEDLVKHAASICVDMLDAQQAASEKNSVWDCMKRQLQAGINVEEEKLNNMSRVIFMVGASGTGKTSTLAKLAVRLASHHGRKTGWLCADTVRISSLAEARTYTDSIGIPLRVAYTPDEVQHSINSYLDEVEFILVDTPAYNPRSEQSIAELGEILTAYAPRCTWVVIPATAKESDVQNILAGIGPFKPRGLVFTKLDETNNFSAVYNVAWRSQLPLTYFSMGSKIVDDLMPARADALVRAVFDERFMP
ncbi:MAG: hypothetical protein LWX83_05565 [Anaerolineae bacterium]|nr:hypothetical protein [Anaerolineae bacterium]